MLNTEKVAQEYSMLEARVGGSVSNFVIFCKARKTLSDGGILWLNIFKLARFLKFRPLYGPGFFHRTFELKKDW